MGQHELHFLNQYRTRWYAYLRHFVIAPPEMEDVDQSFDGSNDTFSNHVCCNFPGRARRPCLDDLVSRARLEQLWHLAEFSKPADVGRVRGLDLFHGLGFVLVHWTDS